MATTLACNSGWLDSTAPTISGSVTATNAACTTASVNGCGDTWYYGGYWYPYYPTVPFYQTATTERRVSLKLSEVERLRKAAKDDPKLKAILNKFTEFIEITVDFD